MGQLLIGLMIAVNICLPVGGENFLGEGFLRAQKRGGSNTQLRGGTTLNAMATNSNTMQIFTSMNMYSNMTTHTCLVMFCPILSSSCLFTALEDHAIPIVEELGGEGGGQGVIDKN